jgi:hypothetical protein
VPFFALLTICFIKMPSRIKINGWSGCRSSKLNLRRIDGPYPQRMPQASGCSVVSDRDGLRSTARYNSIYPTVAVIRTWPASFTQLSARCTDDEDRRCEARPEVGVVRSGVAQPAGSRLPYAALRHEIRGQRSSLLPASAPPMADQGAQVQGRQPRIPSHPNTGSGLTSRKQFLAS